jgi:small multidrug resistance pump
MNWIYLTLAILTEVIGTVFIKMSAGFSRLVPSVLMVVFYLISYFFFNLSLKKIELGTAYAIWSGLGIVLLATLGAIFFKEQLSLVKVLAMVLIIVGVVVLNISSGTEVAAK